MSCSASDEDANWIFHHCTEKLREDCKKKSVERERKAVEVALHQNKIKEKEKKAIAQGAYFTSEEDKGKKLLHKEHTHL